MRTKLLAALLLGFAPAAALAQPSAADRADASIAREELRQEPAARTDASLPPRIEENASGASSSLQQILVGAIRIDGAVALRPAEFATAIEPWLGRQLGPAELRQVATDIANVARRAGYGLASAWIAPQRVANGTVTVTLDEGRIDAVEADGDAKANVEHLLGRLVSRGPVRTADLERQLLLAGDVAGVSIERARIERRDGRNILRVHSRQAVATGRASLDNWGSSIIGPVRARIDADYNGALLRGDRISVSAVVTPLQPSEFQFLRAAYSVGIGRSGTQAALAAYVAQSTPSVEAGQKLEGTSFDVEATLSHPLLRSRAASIWANVQLGLRDSRLDRDDARIRKDKLATISAGLNAVGKTGDGWLRARLTLVQGLDAFGATEAGDPLASRADGSAVFTKVAFSAHYGTSLSGRLGIALGMEGQLASRPLLASEEMGLGGRFVLRGYEYREAAGDRGAAAFAELRYELKPPHDWLRRAQVYLYGDAGRVSNLGGGTGGGTLASAGGGVRLWLRQDVEASLGLGIPLRDAPFSGDPDPRLSFTIGYGF